MKSDQPSTSRRIRRWVVASVLVLAIVAGGVLWMTRRDGPEPSTGESVAAQTEAVIRTDLIVTRSLTGTLGFGRAQPIKGGKEGVITWLPRTGASVDRGEQLFRADDQPVPLFYGAMPLYRTLDRGMVGRDVNIVASNLKALGYPIGRQPKVGETVTRTVPLPVEAAPEPAAGDDDAATGAESAPRTRIERATVQRGQAAMTAGLISALKRWQRDTGLPVTGTIGVGDVVVLSGGVRIESVMAVKGDSAATPLLTVTSTVRVVTAEATVSEAGTIRAGDKVTVRLPGDTSVRGEVSAVSAQVQPADESGTEPAEPRRSVTVTLDSTKVLGGIEQSAVQVDLAGETREDVLAVPVGALVALSEGGYGVQLAGGKLVGVETGLFAKGLVEVTGDGIDEGVEVVTTS
ncbi:efflux RND transporter periplasmic adaptor subunit [Actinoplanes sichuanensis]|uniref:Multidrug efflux pump subunit AcrA (Membrane-fusion protein) n=1 Tax=Actinoplanes sichuanensis TaxID=512349 RepID=A0ABW4AR41_9ACTN|nr:hypothetical protein [Actinoplanes sichuanensis]